MLGVWSLRLSLHGCSMPLQPSAAAVQMVLGVTWSAVCCRGRRIAVVHVLLSICVLHFGLCCFSVLFWPRLCCTCLAYIDQNPIGICMRRCRDDREVHDDNASDLHYTARAASSVSCIHCCASAKFPNSLTAAARSPLLTSSKHIALQGWGCVIQSNSTSIF